MYTIDDMMICYKRTSYPLRQYILQKPQNWGIMVWYIACLMTKFLSNFAIHCGKNENIKEVACVVWREARLAYNSFEFGGKCTKERAYH
jgi:hypothetical protein